MFHSSFSFSVNFSPQVTVFVIDVATNEDVERSAVKLRVSKSKNSRWRSHGAAALLTTTVF